MALQKWRPGSKKNVEAPFSIPKHNMFLGRPLFVVLLGETVRPPGSHRIKAINDYNVFKIWKLIFMAPFAILIKAKQCN